MAELPPHMRVTRLRAKQARITERKAAMRAMFEITSEGDLVDDGEIYALFSFDPEALSNDLIE
jgi:hypothetical protein